MKTKGFGIGDRMKEYYENTSRITLQRKTPVIIRLDGRAFHTYTKVFKKEGVFSEVLKNAFVYTVTALADQIQGLKCAYLQSDEVSLLLSDLDYIETQAWFGYSVQKITSVCASMFTATFNEAMKVAGIDGRLATFDCRCFNIPEHEINNYFIWRQQDWIRNSIQMLGQSEFSHKELQGKKCSDILILLLNRKGVSWEHLASRWKYGTFITMKPEYTVHNPTPVFMEQKELIPMYFRRGEDA